jgi:lysophospholipase L1-like esterase
MPLWHIFSHPDTFSLEQRAALARDITALYGLLPAFYVNVIFINLGENDIWIGGKPKVNFVRIVIEQIARTLPDAATENGKARRKGWMDRINEVYPTLTLFCNVAPKGRNSG